MGMASRGGLLLLAALPGALAIDNAAFVADLENCIETASTAIASNALLWGDRCSPMTMRDELEASLWKPSLDAMHARWGYSGALWCAFYTSVMEKDGLIKTWRDGLLCPWIPGTCQYEEIGNTHDGATQGDEAEGVPKAWGIQLCDDPWNCRARGEQNTKAMSCGLCGHLERKFGGAPFWKSDAHWPAAWHHSPRYALFKSSGRANMAAGGTTGWDNMWDMHVFGHWHGNHLADRFHANPQMDLEGVMDTVHRYRITNTEETHGTLWAFIARLAGTSHNHIALASKLCEQARQRGGVTYLEAAHGVGHGLFYYHMTNMQRGTAGYTLDGQTVINRAMADCKNAAIWQGQYCNDCFIFTPGGGVEWWCAAGVTHSATNSLSLDVIQAIGDSTAAVKAFVCISATDKWQVRAVVCARGRSAPPLDTYSKPHLTPPASSPPATRRPPPSWLATRPTPRARPPASRARSRPGTRSTELA